MPRLLALATLLAAATLASAHAPLIVPQAPKPGGEVPFTVVFSDSLEPDANIKSATWKKLETLKLTAKSADGKSMPVAWAKGEHKLTGTAPAGTTEVSGSVVYGTFAKGDNPVTLLKYYPKALVGPLPSALPPTAGEGFDLAAVSTPDGVRFRVTNAGKPLGGVTVTLDREGADKGDELTTDDAGMTKPVAGLTAGTRFHAVARHTLATSGEHAGAKYEKVTLVGTLVGGK